LQVVASKLQAAGSSVAALASSRLPAENLYAFRQLFNHGLHSRTVACIEEDLTSARPQDLSLEGDLQALKNADCVLVVGADLVKSHQVAGFFIKRNRPAGVTIIVVDPNENEMESVAHYSLRCNPGSDQALLRGVLAGVVNLGFNKNGAKDYDPELINQAAARSGIPAETLVAVSRELGAAQSPVIIYGKGITRSVDGNLEALEELARASGAMLLNPHGKANSVAASRYGLDQHFSTANHDLVYLALGDDFSTPRLQDSLKSAPYLIVQASYADPLTESADVVLPVEMWAEQEGHFVNLEGRLQKVNRALTSLPTVRSNQAVIDAIAAQLQLELDSDWRQALASLN
jgi:predicted molibdopterin-dependent oxidoreductase YjgC